LETRVRGESCAGAIPNLLQHTGLCKEIVNTHELPRGKTYSHLEVV
jgi:hypothetical protein